MNAATRLNQIARFALLAALATSCRSNPADRTRTTASESTSAENTSAARGASTPAAANSNLRTPSDPSAPFNGDRAAMERWNADQIAWFTHEEGVAAAAAANMPALAIVSAGWCPRCTEYAALFSDQAVVEASRDFVMILLDESAPAATRHLALDGGYVPRTVFLSPDGEPDTSLNSGRSDYRHFLNPSAPDQLLALMAQAKERY